MSSSKKDRMKKTLVLGASPHPSRYSYLATQRLDSAQHEVIPVGIRNGTIGKHEIITAPPTAEDVDTVTLYVGPARQPPYYDYIFSLHPKRIIFNPGTENPELMRLAHERGVETVIGCTLVMLATGEY